MPPEGSFPSLIQYWAVNEWAMNIFHSYLIRHFIREYTCCNNIPVKIYQTPSPSLESPHIPCELKIWHLFLPFSASWKHSLIRQMVDWIPYRKGRGIVEIWQTSYGHSTGDPKIWQNFACPWIGGGWNWDNKLNLHTL